MIPIAKPFLGEEEAKAAHDTVLSGWVTQGPKVAAFEEQFVEYTRAHHAVAVSSCTTALHLALIAAGVKHGDEVICPSMSFIATANSIVYAGATPVFAEVNDEYNLDVEDVRNRITSKTKAIILVHQVGMPGDIDAFTALCSEKGLALVEDAACAIGCSYKGRKIGSHSPLVAFSLHPRKVITTGDGGMVTTNNEEMAARMKLLRQHGMSVTDRERFASNKPVFEQYVEVGYNYRLTDIQASIGIEQMKKLDTIVEMRRAIAHRYNAELADIPGLKLPIEREGYTSNYQSYSILLGDTVQVDRDELIQMMMDEGVATKRGIMASHREPAYSGSHANCSLPRTEKLCDRSILIPLFTQMTDEEVSTVIAAFKKCLGA